MKVNYQERIEDTVTVLKIIMSQQRTVTLQTKSSGTLFVKIWFEPEHYRCSWGASHFCKSLKKGKNKKASKNLKKDEVKK